MNTVTKRMTMMMEMTPFIPSPSHSATKILDMPTSGDLKSGNLFFWPPTPSPTPHPLYRLEICTVYISHYVDLRISVSAPSNFSGKTWIYLWGTSTVWILIQSESRLHRSNEEETIFFFVYNEQRASRMKMKPETVIQAQGGRWFWNFGTKGA